MHLKGSHLSSTSLFEPVAFGPLHLQNRFVMNPMTRCRADDAAVPTAIMATYYGQRADAGLIVTEGIATSPNGRGYTRTPGLWTAAQTEAWKPVTAAAHAGGAKIFAQLMHVGRVAHPANMIDGGKIVSASDVILTGQMYTDAAGMQDYPAPQPLTAAEIDQTKAEFVTTARNAIAAGFDGIELHAANGYLLEQFLSPDTNHRTDGYGGSVENRIRFVVEVAQATADAIGGDKVGIRISPYGTASGMGAYPEVQDTYLQLVAALGKAGLVYVHLVDHVATGNPAIPADFKQALRAAFPGTFILGGSLDAATAQTAIDAGLTDLAGLGRAFLANPGLVSRLKLGLDLNAPDFGTLYTPGTVGYTDYPLAA
jgi:N-ethylmaleimide reductase